MWKLTGHFGGFEGQCPDPELDFSSVSATDIPGVIYSNVTADN
jgi:hypothetical protein